MQMRKVLHVTTHMGGGVGKALSGIAAYAQQHLFGWRHSILLLEPPEKTNFVDICRRNHVELRIARDADDIVAAIHDSDIVQVEWWHHPRMCRWLANFPNLPMRLVFWCHVSGCFYPYLPPSLLRIPQKFIFTSRCSFDNPYWDEGTREWARQHCAVVNSSGGFDAISPARKEHVGDGFCIGYAGTQSFSKIHPNFIRFCQAVADLPGVGFRMVGDKNNEAVLLEQAAQHGLADLFHFVGYTADINEEFSRMDVFGYLLNPTHFGTTENVLLEAMAAELPVVCLNQCAEKYLVQHGKTGLLVRSIEEYGQAIYFLHTHPEERKRLGQAARKYVLEHFAAGLTVKLLHGLYDEILGREKEQYNFQGTFGKIPHEFFLACLPPSLRKNFKVDSTWPLILREENKSSLPHFCRCYPEDEILQRWNGMLDGGNYA